MHEPKYIFYLFEFLSFDEFRFTEDVLDCIMRMTASWHMSLVLILWKWRDNAIM